MRRPAQLGALCGLMNETRRFRALRPRGKRSAALAKNVAEPSSAHLAVREAVLRCAGGFPCTRRRRRTSRRQARRTAPCGEVRGARHGARRFAASGGKLCPAGRQRLARCLRCGKPAFFPCGERREGIGAGKRAGGFQSMLPVWRATGCPCLPKTGSIRALRAGNDAASPIEFGGNRAISIHAPCGSEPRAAPATRLRAGAQPCRPCDWRSMSSMTMS